MVQFDVKRVQKGAESFMVSFDFTKTPVTQIADYIIIAASKYGASDIHFDPRGEGMMIRFRIDGDCQDYTFVPKAYEKNLSTRLKIMANMNITESRLPQDGAIKGNFGDTYLDMRVSSLPLNEGEKIVIRILDYSRSLEGIDTLGFHPDNLEKVKRMMGLPNGIILTTGATGSGKSTTTYSILQGLNRSETNIITVEDPIEMNIDGINQVQVNAEIGMTFAAALRSILRQDPNVILIGEIRDSETAQIAVRASITGHLVLSTIHTNNALATIERLLDMDVERYLLSTALAGIISQRLGKMLCPDCHYQRETTKYEKKVFKKFLNKDIAMVWDANPNGCEHCRRGYHGRIAFHEVLEIDENVRAAISNEKLDKKDLAKMVYVGKTITMLQDALYKCLNGETSFEEVYRNIEIENEDDDNYESEMENEIAASAPVDESSSEVASDDLLDTTSTPTTSDVAVYAQVPINTAESIGLSTSTPTATPAAPQSAVMPGALDPAALVDSVQNTQVQVPTTATPVIPTVQATSATALPQVVPTTTPAIPQVTIPTVTPGNVPTPNQVDTQSVQATIPIIGETSQPQATVMVSDSGVVPVGQQQVPVAPTVMVSDNGVVPISGGSTVTPVESVTPASTIPKLV